jgi:hypothetical protein
MQFMPPQIKYLISHQLSRSVKRNITAAVTLEYLDTASRQCIGRSEHISSFGVAPESNDGRMFQQEQHVADLSRLAQIDQPPLQAQPFGITNLTELDDRNHVAIEIIGPQWKPGGT